MKTWRSNWIPLTTKKMGMRNPNPMASSLPRTAAISPPAENRRTTMPAANAPRSTSRPRVSANRTSSTMNRSDTRTGSWALDSMWRPSRATNRGGWARAASSTVATATAMNANSSSEVSEGLLLGQEEGYGHDGAELAHGADGRDVGAEPGVEDVGVAEHGDQRAEGGRGQGQADHHRVPGQTLLHQGEAQRPARRPARWPTRRRPVGGVGPGSSGGRARSRPGR